MPALLWKPMSRRNLNHFWMCYEPICKNYKYYQWLVKVFPELSELTKRQKDKYLVLTLCQTKLIFSFQIRIYQSLCFFLSGILWGAHTPPLLLPVIFPIPSNNTTSVSLFCCLYLPLSFTFHSIMNSLFCGSSHSLFWTNSFFFLFEQDWFMNSLHLLYKWSSSTSHSLPCCLQDREVENMETFNLVLALKPPGALHFSLSFSVSNKVLFFCGPQVWRRPVL